MMTPNFPEYVQNLVKVLPQPLYGISLHILDQAKHLAQHIPSLLTTSGTLFVRHLLKERVRPPKWRNPIIQLLDGNRRGQINS